MMGCKKKWKLLILILAKDDAKLNTAVHLIFGQNKKIFLSGRHVVILPLSAFAKSDIKHVASRTGQLRLATWG